MISTALPGFCIGRGQERIDFQPGQEIYQRSVVPFSRDSQNALDMIRLSRFLEGHIPEERPEGG